jgi:hypothetical protein
MAGKRNLQKASIGEKLAHMTEVGTQKPCLQVVVGTKTNSLHCLEFS